MKTTKPTPTAPELAGQITAAEASLAALKEQRADLRRQVEFLETQRDECERLNTQRAVYERDYMAGRRFGTELEGFWRTHSEEAVNGRLKAIMEGGCPMLATITESGFESNGRQVFSSRQVELTLPALDKVAEQFAALEADIAAREAALWELRAGSLATFQAAFNAAQRAFEAVKTEESRIQTAIADSRDVDEVIGLRSALDQMPMRRNQAERGCIEAELALLGASSPATSAEIRTAKDELAAAEQAIEAANVAALAARRKLWALSDQGRDTTAQNTKLLSRLEELQFQWAGFTKSRDVRTLTGVR